MLTISVECRESARPGGSTVAPQAAQRTRGELMTSEISDHIIHDAITLIEEEHRVREKEERKLQRVHEAIAKRSEQYDAELEVNFGKELGELQKRIDMAAPGSRTRIAAEHEFDQRERALMFALETKMRKEFAELQRQWNADRTVRRLELELISNGTFQVQTTLEEVSMEEFYERRYGRDAVDSKRGKWRKKKWKRPEIVVERDVIVNGTEVLNATGNATFLPGLRKLEVDLLTENGTANGTQEVLARTEQKVVPENQVVLIGRMDNETLSNLMSKDVWTRRAHTRNSSRRGLPRCSVCKRVCFTHTEFAGSCLA